jgi:uncharacterized membrane protein (DUF373 family)
MVSEKFVGEGYQNNEVKVDFINKKITFVPVTNNSLLRHTIHIINNIIFAVLYFVFCVFLSVLTPLLLAFHYPYSYLWQIFGEKLVWCFAIIVIISIFSSLIAFYKPWRDLYWARYNAGIYFILHILMLDFRCLRWYKITPFDLEPSKSGGNEKFFCTESFSNVELNYKLYGDFAKNITEINIMQAIFKKNKFYAFFYFSEPIKNGYMQLNYY